LVNLGLRGLNGGLERCDVVRINVAAQRFRAGRWQNLIFAKNGLL
jgi:hypothetical protein